MAQQKLAALLSTGLFSKIDSEDDDVADNLAIDYSDPWLYEDHGDVLPIPKDRTLTIDELEQLVVNDIRNICELRDAV